MKIAKIVDPRFQEAFRKLMAEPLPLKVAFKLKGIYTKLQAEVDKYDDVRQNALKRFGKKKEDGELDVDTTGQVKLEGDHLQAFLNEINDLMALDVEIGSVTLAELGDNVQLTTEEVIVLEGVIQP